uniref:Uncharacterized protein n=1 Tax=Panagrolaimus sp. ES5 TaxID=591445 RepID=A0AC34F5M6_9BILA
MASSSITFRRRNVTFTNRPPQIVRYSYHGGADASLGSSTTGISKYPPLLSSTTNEPTYQNMNLNDTSSSSISSSSSPPPPIYDNVPAIRSINSPNNAIINNNNILPKTFAPVPPRKSSYSDGRRMSTGHRWANNDGIERIDVIQKNSGVTHVNIGDKSYYNNVIDDDEDEEMAMHLYECIEQFNTACDKILGARQLIDTDTSLTTNDREKLLKLVNKSISQGRGRLENFDQATTISSSSNRTTTLSGGTGSNASMGAPSHLASPSPTPSEPRLNIDANFINRYGPQIMHLLQENMSKQN